MNPNNESTSSDEEPKSSDSENELNRATRFEAKRESTSDDSPPTKRVKTSPTPKDEELKLNFSDVSTSPELRDNRIPTRDETYRKIDQAALWTMAQASTRDRE